MNISLKFYRSGLIFSISSSIFICNDLEGGRTVQQLFIVLDWMNKILKITFFVLLLHFIWLKWVNEWCCKWIERFCATRQYTMIKLAMLDIHSRWFLLEQHLMWIYFLYIEYSTGMKPTKQHWKKSQQHAYHALPKH